MGLLSTLLVIVLIFYAFSMVVKLIFRHKIKKLERQMGTDEPDETPKDSEKARQLHVDPNIGEYTDFEEIE